MKHGAQADESPSLFPTIAGYSQLLGSLSPGLILPVMLSGYMTPQAGALSLLRGSHLVTELEILILKPDL